MTTNDDKWRQMTTNNDKWRQMTPNDDKWRLITMKWRQMTTNDDKWRQMMTNDDKWRQITTNDDKWRQMTRFQAPSSSISDFLDRDGEITSPIQLDFGKPLIKHKENHDFDSSERHFEPTASSIITIWASGNAFWVDSLVYNHDVHL